MTTATKTKARPTQVLPHYHPITRDNFIKMLMEQRGAMPVTIVTNTIPKMRKGGNPLHGNIYKISKVNGMLNFHYDAGVQRRLAKEGKSPDDFKKGSSWHVPIIRADQTLTPLCHHKDDAQRLYLRFMLIKSLETKYYRRSGGEVPKSEVTPHLSKQSDYKNQGLEEPLKFLVYDVNNIKSIAMNDVLFVVVG